MGAWGHALHGRAGALCSLWRAHAGAGKNREEEGAAEELLCPDGPPPCAASRLTEGAECDLK